MRNNNGQPSHPVRPWWVGESSRGAGLSLVTFALGEPLLREHSPLFDVTLHQNSFCFLGTLKV
jgi:hypothetical protein